MSAGVFNGSFTHLPGATLRRKQQPQNRLYPSNSITPVPNGGDQREQAPVPGTTYPGMNSQSARPVQQSAQSPIPQNTYPGMNVVKLNDGMRHNLTQKAGGMAMRGALRDARSTEVYQQGAGSLDAIRAEFGVNDKDITPEEANRRRTAMFADSRYKSASEQVGTALKPITMAGADTRDVVATDLASTNYLYPGYFQDRQNARDANARANTESTANVGLTQANAGMVQANTGLTQAQATAYPGMQNAVNAERNANAGLTNAKTMAYPGMSAAEIAQMESAAGLNKAKAGEIDANTGRVKEKSDPATLGAQGQIAAADAKAADSDTKALRDRISKLEELLARYQGMEDKKKGSGDQTKDKFAAAANGVTPPPTQGGNAAPQRGQTAGSGGTSQQVASDASRVFTEQNPSPGNQYRNGDVMIRSDGSRHRAYKDEKGARWVSEDEYQQLRANSSAGATRQQQQQGQQQQPASIIYSEANPSPTGKYRAGDIYRMPDGQLVRAVANPAGGGRWVPIQ